MAPRIPEEPPFTSHIPLDRAALCPTCEAIFDNHEDACPCCTNRGRLVLARVLGTVNEKRAA